MGTVTIRPRGPVAQFADWLMRPVMYILSGTIREAPQETHKWNNLPLAPSDIEYLDKELMVFAHGDPDAKMRWFLGIIPLFHMPLFGGWRKYHALEPVDHRGKWYVGWIPEDAPAGYSRVPAVGGVRALEGPGPCRWFGLDGDGNQIALRELGVGHTGRGGPFARLPLR